MGQPSLQCAIIHARQNYKLALRELATLRSFQRSIMYLDLQTILSRLSSWETKNDKQIHKACMS